MSASGTDAIDIGALANQALALFQAAQYKECLATTDTLLRMGASGSGLHYITAVCCFHLGEYVRGVDELARECRRPDGIAEAKSLTEQIQSETRQNPTLNRELTPGRYLISGLPPGDSGTGRFLAALEPIAQRSGFTPLYPLPHGQFSQVEKIRLGEVRDSELLLMHPQSLGFGLFKQLVEANRKVRMYVLDSSFFCIRSYNFRPERQGECLDCLAQIRQCHQSCQPFPASTDRESNLQFLEWLQTAASKISFYCQTEPQKKLLEKHFGNNVVVTVVGMLTQEYQPTKVGKAEVVFHGEALSAKGLRFAIEMASHLPGHSFLIPADLGQVLQETKLASLPGNVRCEDIRWNTGLSEAIALCRLVLCPSQWSAPVEGALMKSLYYNGNVAVMETNFAFERELPDDIVLRLRPNSMLAAQQVGEFLTSEKCNREKARRWVEEYNKRVSLGRIFD